jgi:hypothetical protein
LTNFKIGIESYLAVLFAIPVSWFSSGVPGVLKPISGIPPHLKGQTMDANLRLNLENIRACLRAELGDRREMTRTLATPAELLQAEVIADGVDLGDAIRRSLEIAKKL